MEESTSILFRDAKGINAGELQQSLHNNSGHIQTRTLENQNISRLIEAENKLNQVFEEYSSRIESFMLMLETLREGVVIINKAGETCFANDPGNTLSTEINQLNPAYLRYCEWTSEENMVLPLNAQREIHIRVNNFFWNGEPCNIFVIEKKDLPEKEAPVTFQTTSPLSAPFEALINCLQQIATHQANGNTTEATACAELAGKSISQSEKLLGDIKSFIGLATYEPVPSQISMQKLVGDVLKSMGPEIEEAEVEVTVSDLPETKADKDLVLKLFKHLVHNALKFRNKNRKAVIDIGHDKSDGQFIFCIRDNGIGISKKHHEQIFNLFSTLNDTNEYPGNGIGLAICKKIIELHDGKIWVESLPGHGSNFYFKLNTK